MKLAKPTLVIALCQLKTKPCNGFENERKITVIKLHYGNR